MQWLTQIECWHWWILAGLFMLLELSSPKMFYLLLGVVAASMGFMIFAFPALPAAMQAMVFVGLSALALVTWRRYRRT